MRRRWIAILQDFFLLERNIFQQRLMRPAIERCSIQSNIRIRSGNTDSLFSDNEIIRKDHPDNPRTGSSVWSPTASVRKSRSWSRSHIDGVNTDSLIDRAIYKRLISHSFQLKLHCSNPNADDYCIPKGYISCQQVRPKLEIIRFKATWLHVF